MSDSEKTWLKNWLASVSVVLVLQIGSLIWFLAEQRAEQRRVAQVVDRIEPQHSEIYYFYRQLMQNKK